MTSRSSQNCLVALSLLIGLVAGCSSDTADPNTAQKTLQKSRTNPTKFTKAGQQTASGVETGDVVAAPPGVKTGIPAPGNKAGGG